MIETLPITFDRRELARRGLTPESAGRQVEAAFQGVTVGTVADGLRRTDITVRLAPEDRATPRQLEDWILHSPSGAPVRLREVATIGWERASNLIAHENGRRKAVVSCNVAPGANLGDLVSAVRARVDPIVQQAGCTVTYGGQFEAQQSAFRTILLGSIGVGILVYLMLAQALHSRRAALLVLVNLPLGLIGGVVGVLLLPSPQGPIGQLLGALHIGHFQPPILTIPALVGFVTLFGIAIRNGILLVNHYRYLQRTEHLPLQQAVIRGSMERLVPILMTAMSAILGLVPLAMALGQPGGELLAPLAVVVLFGLVTSTTLNLFVLPASYLWTFGSTPHRRSSS
jgi:HME family heavy-metal exporter